MSEMPEPTQTLYILDGTAMLFRSYFGKFRKTNPDGVEVGAVMGMTMYTAKFIKTVKPQYLAAVFDAGRLTFRNEIDPQYKANRGEPPDDLIPQFGLAPEAMTALGIRHFSMKGYEADDLMATLATRMESQGFQTVLAATDKDLLQCIRPGVWCMDMKTFGLIGPNEVMTKYGVRPDQMIDLQSLVGDSTDNISGVRGIGSKGASRLLTELGSLDEIYNQLSEVATLPIRGAKSLAQKLSDGRSDAAHARRLVTLKKDVPSPDVMNLHPTDLRYGGANKNGLPFFDRMGFHGPWRALHQLGQT